MSRLGTLNDSYDLSVDIIQHFGINIEGTENEVLASLENEVTKPKIRREPERLFLTIGPGNQILSEGTNLDYSIGFFDGKIIGMTFFNKDDQFLNILSTNNEIEKPLISKENENATIYEWTVKNIQSRCWKDDNSDLITYSFRNTTVELAYDKYVEKILENDPFF